MPGNVFAHQLLATLVQLAEHPARGHTNQKSAGKTHGQAAAFGTSYWLRSCRPRAAWIARLRGTRAPSECSTIRPKRRSAISLLNKGADILLAAEAPDGNWEARLGKAPPIYSREINYWLFAAALDILHNQPEIGLIYMHTTDYPMHMWPPEASESQEHLSRLDNLLAELAAAAPEAAILVTPITV